MGPATTRDALAEQIARYGYEIGDYTYGAPAVWNYGEDRLRIGRFCSIGVGVTLILGGEHTVENVTTAPLGLWVGRPGLEGLGEPTGIDIGNDVWIGQRATVLSGVRIGDGAVVGAGAVVAKDVEPFGIVVGNPARLVRKRFDDAQISSLLEIAWWNWPIEQVGELASLLMSADVDAFIAAARGTLQITTGA